MFKIGTLVSTVSEGESLIGLVVPVSAIFQAGQHIAGYETPGLTYVLITTAGEFQGSIYPFQYHQLETISEPS